MPTPTPTPSPASRSTTPAPPAAVLLNKATSYKVELKLGFAKELTQAEETKVKQGIASAAKVSVTNVDLKKDSRRSVSYTATVYTKDASSANTVKGSLGEAALKSALAAAGAPTPASVGSASTVEPSPASRSTASVIGCSVMAVVSVGMINTGLYLK